MTARIPFVDLGLQHAELGEEIDGAIRRVLDSQRFILGPEVDAFERAVEQYLGVRHAIGVSSGTDALLMALTAVGVEPGSEVVTTPFSFFATAESIVRAGGHPRFVDIDPNTLNLDVNLVPDAVTARTRAVVPVHLFGTPARVDVLGSLMHEKGIPVIEDAAQAFGSQHFGRATGTWGKVGCFSFFPTKVLGALGDAGMIVTDDDALAGRCRALRQHGSTGGHGGHRQIGGNFRLDPLQAAVLGAKLRTLPEKLRRRRAHAAAYDAAFGELRGVTLVDHGSVEGWNAAVYTLLVRDGRRDALEAHLAARGIETRVYYRTPLHLEPALSYLGVVRGALPEAERAAKEVLSLPLYAEMSENVRGRIIEAVHAFFAS